MIKERRKVKNYIVTVFCTSKFDKIRRRLKFQVVAYTDAEAMSNAVSDAHALNWRNVRVHSVSSGFTLAK